MAREFTGTTYSTQKGSTLTVLEPTSEFKGGKRLYKVVCSVCSLDKELFPTLTSSISNLNKGAVPCGCAKIPKWKLEQYKILLDRMCKTLSYTWEVKDSEIKGKTRLTLTCGIHDFTWSTTTVNAFLKQGVRCLLCSQEKLNEKNLQLLEQELKVKGFLHEEDFITRNLLRLDSKGSKSYINLHCSVCRKDEYTEGGTCTGVFPTQIYSLRNGHKPCRCSNSFSWSKEQRESQILQVCSENGGRFLKWLEDFKGSYTKFSLCCDKGHTFSKTVNELVNNRSWCKICSLQESSCYGFYPDRVSEIDYLYVMDFSNPYKVGRSFEPNLRLSQLSSVSDLQGRILHKYVGLHKNIYDMEQDILAYIKANRYNFDCDWTTEAFYPRHYKDILDYIKTIQHDYKVREVL